MDKRAIACLLTSRLKQAGWPGCRAETSALASVSKTSLGLKPRAVFETSTKYFSIWTSQPVNNICKISNNYIVQRRFKISTLSRPSCWNEPRVKLRNVKFAVTQKLRAIFKGLFIWRRASPGTRASSLLPR